MRAALGARLGEFSAEGVARRLPEATREERRGCLVHGAASLLYAAALLGLQPPPGGEARPALGSLLHMSLRRSPAVQEWLTQQSPLEFQPRRLGSGR